jgi:hypothetical protein
MGSLKRRLLFGGETIEYWNAHWQRLAGGFSVEHREVYGRAGLYQAVLAESVVFVGCSIKLHKRLQQLRSEKELRTNSYYSARKIREHTGELELEVLLPERRSGVCLDINALKWAMIRQLRPVWNYGPRFRRKDSK